MALIIEDGTNVAGANSYVALDDARVYAEMRGMSLPDDDALAETYLVRAFDAIESYEKSYSGVRKYQETAFPRSGMSINGFSVSDTTIPFQVIYAQVHFASAIADGYDISPVLTNSSMVIREKVGQLETEYADPSSFGYDVPRITSAMSLLSALFGSGNPKQLNLVRC